jgi:hypothetical protein
MTRHRLGKGTKLSGRYQANPVRAVRVRTPDAAVPVRSMPGWDAGTRPGPAAAREGRARYRPRPPPGEASWTSPHALCIQHRFEQDSSPSRAAQLVRSLLHSLPRQHGRDTRQGTGPVTAPVVTSSGHTVVLQLSSGITRPVRRRSWPSGAQPAGPGGVPRRWTKILRRFLFGVARPIRWRFLPSGTHRQALAVVPRRRTKIPHRSCSGWRARYDGGFCHRARNPEHRGVRGVAPPGENSYASAAAPAAFASGVDSAVEVRGAGAEAPMAPSERISIRHPVSRAASRAFCPSLPMASESW